VRVSEVQIVRVTIPIVRNGAVPPAVRETLLPRLAVQYAFSKLSPQSAFASAFVRGVTSRALLCTPLSKQPMSN